VLTKECRRGLDITGTSIPSYYCVIRDCHVTGGGHAEDGDNFFPVGSISSDGIGSHGGAFGTIFEGNTIVDAYHGILTRGREERILNNLIGGNAYIPIALAWGANTIVEGNRYIDQIDAGYTATTTGRPEQFIYVNANAYDWTTPLTIRDNDVATVLSEFLYLDGDAALEIPYLTIRDNIISIAADTPATVYLINSGSAKYLTDYVEMGNKVSTIAADAFLKYGSVGFTTSTISLSSVSQMGTTQYWTTILDDQAVSIRLGTAAAQLIAQAYNAGTSTTPRLNAIMRNDSATNVDLGASSGFTIAATALTGTTGSDGNITISFAAKTFYCENRSGTAINIMFNLIA